LPRRSKEGIKNLSDEDFDLKEQIFKTGEKKYGL